MKRMVSAVIPIALTIPWVGCSNSQKVVEGVDTSRAIGLETPSGQYTLPQAWGSPGSAITGKTSEGLEWSLKDGVLRVKTNAGLECSLKDGILRFNNRAYGAVRAGDKVKIDKAGAVWVNGQERQPTERSMGIDMIDLAFRLERHFGVRLSMEELRKMWMKNEPPDIRVGELFDFVCGLVPQPEGLDLDADADSLWPLFQRDVSDALGVELREVTKDKWLAHDLGAE